MKLRRSGSDQMVGGVCAGLAKEFSLDPAIVRIGFLAAFLFWGIGVIPYVILWIVLPEED